MRAELQVGRLVADLHDGLLDAHLPCRRNEVRQHRRQERVVHVYHDHLIQQVQATQFDKGQHQLRYLLKARRDGRANVRHVPVRPHFLHELEQQGGRLVFYQLRARLLTFHLHLLVQNLQDVKYCLFIARDVAFFQPFQELGSRDPANVGEAHSLRKAAKHLSFPLPSVVGLASKWGGFL